MSALRLKRNDSVDYGRNRCDGEAGEALNGGVLNRNALKAECLLLIIDKSLDNLGLICFLGRRKLDYVAFGKEVGTNG